MFNLSQEHKKTLKISKTACDLQTFFFYFWIANKIHRKIVEENIICNKQSLTFYNVIFLGLLI